MANLGKILSRHNKIDLDSVMVIGLGRFGSAVADELISHGVDVLGIDTSTRIIQEHRTQLTEAIVADTTETETLVQLSALNFDKVVIGIGSNLEASILTTSNLVELGAKDIWAKADSDAHARILSQVGVHHVVRPERETGRRVAHLLAGKFQEFAEFDNDYGMIKMVPPKFLRTQRVDNGYLIQKYGVHIVSARVNGVWGPVQPGATLTKDDLVILAGKPTKLEQIPAQ